MKTLEGMLVTDQLGRVVGIDVLGPYHPQRLEHVFQISDRRQVEALAQLPGQPNLQVRRFTLVVEVEQLTSDEIWVELAKR